MWLFLILLILIIIGLIVYFWATIWAILKIILGIAGVAAIIISIFRSFVVCYECPACDYEWEADNCIFEEEE